MTTNDYEIGNESNRDLQKIEIIAWSQDSQHRRMQYK